MTVRLNNAGAITEVDDIGQATRADGAAQHARTVNAIAEPSIKRRVSVLVVDDEATVRLLITEVLEDLGYASLEAIDGASGLQILQSDAPIGLMITDVGLPSGMNGRHLAAAARVARPGIAVLFITGYAETAAIGDGGLEPRTMVLTKPFSIDALTSSIMELMS